MGLIVFVGDWVKCYNREDYNRVVDIVDNMTVLLDNGRRVPATEDVIEDLKSANEYSKFLSNFGGG